MSDQTASQPQIKSSWLLGIALALVLFSAIGGYSSRMTWNTPDYDQERAADRYATLAKLQADESKQLNPTVIDPGDGKPHPTAIWVDQAKGLISIPIGEAMVKVVDDLKAKTCGPGCEINPAPAAPAAAAPTAAAPAPTTNAAPAVPAAPEAKPPAPAAKPAEPAAPPAKPKT